ncbi:MAG: PEGA domain-containing protein [Anaerolineales bacterium]|nr:PEGA domain-containing protein [Anaerolineales bacterium]
METSIAQTEAARPTATPVPTDTPAPSDTPAPTDTQAPPPTQPPAAPPTQTPTEEPELAYVEVTNRLGAQLTVKLRGPELRTFMIAGLSKMTLEILPGEYSYTLSAKGYNDLTGTVTFTPGENTWSIGKANP